MALASSRAQPSSLPALSSPPVLRRLVIRRPRYGAAAVIAVVLFLALGIRFADAGSAPANAANAVKSVHSITASIAEASQRFGIPASWLQAVIGVESGGDTYAVSPKGAMGLMQIMPKTWASLRLRYGLGTDPFDAHDNILAGAAYLRELHDRYGAPGFLAAYDAGPARYEAYLATGRPLPNETFAYVDRLAPLVATVAVASGVVLAAAMPSWLEAPLFVVHSDSALMPSRSTSELHDRQSSIVVRLADLTGLVPQSNGLFAAVTQQGGTR
ncbi:MAG TPA: lytic transglycosylase domain-containing protein [Stellaceae bacterium]|nr:lytic transglycosylase domain-containing protein [Stellaceae bacterium]